MSRAFVIVLVLGAVACGAGGDGTPSVDGNPTTDAPTGCTVGITYMPTTPIAAPGTVIRAVAHVDGSTGLHTFTWFLSINNGPNMTPESALPDNSEVMFPATMDALYRVRFRIEDPNCAEASEDIDVNAPGVGEVEMRVHVVAPPIEHRPVVDKSVIVQGGANDLIDDVQLAQVPPLDGHVLLGGTGIPAYLKFMPGGTPDAAVEAFSDGTGSFHIEVRNETHTVLVVPASQNFPPQLVNWTGQTTLDLATGIPITGTVRDPANAAIANAKVQLVIGGLPSTIGTTDSGGTFVVAAMPPAVGANVRVEVSPPATTGLPRLVAESSLLDVSQSVAVRYSASVSTRDLANTVVQRSAPLANADVSIVGPIPSVGTVTAGAAVSADGEARFSAKTNGSGALPTLRVPATQLFAVVFPAGAIGDHAVTPIDLTTAVPATITAAATTAKTTRISNAADTTGLGGSVLDAVPLGPLALAGAPTIRKTATSTGQVTIGLASNATYELRFSDPNGNRGALRVLSDATTADVAATTPLLDPTRVTGKVIGGSPIAGAIVQFLCAQCTGLARDRPIAEGLTGVDGRFSLAVPNPN